MCNFRSFLASFSHDNDNDDDDDVVDASFDIDTKERLK